METKGGELIGSGVSSRMGRSALPLSSRLPKRYFNRSFDSSLFPLRIIIIIVTVTKGKWDRCLSESTDERFVYYYARE